MITYLNAKLFFAKGHVSAMQSLAAQASLGIIKAGGNIIVAAITTAACMALY